MGSSSCWMPSQRAEILTLSNQRFTDYDTVRVGFYCTISVSEVVCAVAFEVAFTFRV